MNINTGVPVTTYSRLTSTKITDNQETATAVDVPWGYYLASQNDRILTRVMTTSLNSCIGYLFWDKGNSNFLFAHISTDGEACSAVSLVKELTNQVYSQDALFVCVTGIMPSDQTATRINHIAGQLNQPHRCFSANTGGVVVDLSLETIMQTKRPKAANISISESDKKAAMSKKPNLPLYGIQYSNSWVGNGTIPCPAITKPTTQRGRSGSLGDSRVKNYT